MVAHTQALYAKYSLAAARNWTQHHTIFIPLHCKNQIKYLNSVRTATFTFRLLHHWLGKRMLALWKTLIINLSTLHSGCKNHGADEDCYSTQWKITPCTKLLYVAQKMLFWGMDFWSLQKIFLPFESTHTHTLYNTFKCCIDTIPN